MITDAVGQELFEGDRVVYIPRHRHGQRPIIRTVDRISDDGIVELLPGPASLTGRNVRVSPENVIKIYEQEEP